MVIGFHKPSFKTCPSSQKSCESRTLVGLRFVNWLGPCLEPRRWSSKAPLVGIHCPWLIVRLGDVQPSRTLFPTFESTSEHRISLRSPTNGQTVGQCSVEEPPNEVVWLPWKPRADGPPFWPLHLTSSTLATLVVWVAAGRILKENGTNMVVDRT